MLQTITDIKQFYTNKTSFAITIFSHNTYLETARAVIEAGSALSLRSYAVCIVNLLRNTNCLCHLNPEKKISLSHYRDI